MNISINPTVVNLLGQKSKEHFMVTFDSGIGHTKTWGPDTASGIISYVLSTDQIISVERVEYVEHAVPRLIRNFPNG